MGHYMMNTCHSPETLASMYVEVRKNKFVTVSTRKALCALRLVLPPYRYSDEEIITLVAEAAVDAGLAVEFDTRETS